MDISNVSSYSPRDLLLRGDPSGAFEKLPDSEGGEKAEPLQAAARRFEGIFVHQILRQMKETILEADSEVMSDTEEKDSSGEQIQSMYWSFLADAISERGGFGFWEKIYQQLLSGAESPNTDPPAGVDEKL